MNQIHPVILPVSPADRQLAARERVRALSAHARLALALSAEFSAFVLGELQKDASGAPRPSNGIYWSLTHKTAYVAAVAATEPIGIDIEKRRECHPGLYRRIADEQEWALVPAVTEMAFFRFWTAKEAVLKAVGKGLIGLSDCRIHQIMDDTRLQLTYNQSRWTVVQRWIGSDHLVAVTADHVEICWHVLS